MYRENLPFRKFKYRAQRSEAYVIIADTLLSSVGITYT